MADEGDKVPPGWTKTSEGRHLSPEFVVAAVIAVLLVIFIVQNSERAPVTWLVFDRNPPVWAIIVVSAVAGYLLGQLIEIGFRRRRRNRDRA
ncbi:MAG TPA: hypothetical protein VGQ20_04065 [Acidimicrobiales bacterium]|nr:hypothetical protein [Acidimicrobiales bacterium]